MGQVSSSRLPGERKGIRREDFGENERSVGLTVRKAACYGGARAEVAQLVEHSPEKAGVDSSILSLGTTPSLLGGRRTWTVRRSAVRLGFLVFTMKFELYTDAALARDVPEHRLKRGDIVKLVDYHVAPDGTEGYSVEVLNAVGGTLAVIVVPASALEALRQDEVLSARSL